MNKNNYIIKLMFWFFLYFCNSIGYAQEEEKEVNIYEATQFYEQAKNAYDDKNYQVAKDFFTLAIEENPNNSDYLFGRSLSYLALNQFDSAAIDIEKAILFEPNQPDYHHYAGNIYFKYGDINLAVTNYLKAAENQGNGDVYINETSNFYNLGTCFLILKSYAQATIYFTKVIDFDKDYAIAYYNRGIANERLKLKSLACMDFSAAYEKGIEKAKSKISKYCN